MDRKKDGVHAKGPRYSSNPKMTFHQLLFLILSRLGSVFYYFLRRVKIVLRNQNSRILKALQVVSQT